MAETKIVSIEAIQTIQQLKDNIKELKLEVDKLTVGSEDYNEKVVELASNQRALKLAMTGTYDSMEEVAKASRKDTESLNETVKAAQNGTATYNEMSTALGRLKEEIKAIPKYLSEQDQALGQINPAYTQLNSQIQILDSSLKSLDADNGVFTRNVGNYKGALEEWGGAMGQVRQVGNDLQSGIMGLLGVMTLFGVDTDETKESLQALVPVLAVLNAGKGIGGLVKLLPQAAKGQAAVATATAAATAANTANATAAGAATVATEAQTVAQEGLNKSMLANPILAVIAALTALIAVVAKYVSNVNKASRETKAFEAQQKLLNEAFEAQNEQFDREQKLKQAQGVSNQVLLAQKKEHIKAQKAETEALIKNIQARMAQMKADSAWVRFWKGENKAIANLEEQLKGLTEQIKGFDKQIADLDTDIQVDSINKGKEAANKAAKESSELIKKALDIANEAIKANKTELENLTDTYKEQSKVLNDAFEELGAKLNKMKKGTNEYNKLLKMASTIFDGMHKLEEQYGKNKKAVVDKQDADNAKKYGDTINRYLAELNYHLDKATSKERGMERLMDTVLGSAEAQYLLFGIVNNETLQATTETKNLINAYSALKTIIGEDIKLFSNFSGELEDLNISGLSWDAMLMLSQTDANKLAESIGEPLATAIGKWFTADNSLAEATYKGFEEQFAQGITVFNELIAQGPDGVPGAKEMQKQILKLVQNAFNLENPIESPAYMGLLHYFTELINGVLADDEFSLNFSEKFSALLTSQSVHSSFDAALKVVDDFNKAYVQSTADALAAVADLWETSIKWKYKKLVESGKMQEAEAEKQAEKEFKNVKALQIGVAAISTAAAIVQALADPTVPNYYVKAANAIAAGVAGAAQIMTISMTDFGKPSVNVPSSNTSTPSYTQEPQGMYYSVGVNPMDYAEATAQNPVKVYVTDQDIVEGIDNYNARKAEVTF